MIKSWWDLLQMAPDTTTPMQIRVGFDEIKAFLVHRPLGDILINTLPEHQQHCLIWGTTSIQNEIAIINQFLEDDNRNVRITIYGLNHKDPTVEHKQQQLTKMGFRNVFVYLGGLFEWLLLQDIYGKIEFPTTSIQTDILSFHGPGPHPLSHKLQPCKENA